MALQLSFEQALEGYMVDFDLGTVIGPQGKPVGSLGNDGYYRLTVYFGRKRRTIRRSRLIFFKAYGYWPTEIDHKNRIKTDDRLSNLVDSLHVDNIINRKQSLERALPTGVIFKARMRTKPYEARIHYAGQDHSLGHYATPEEAAKAYQIRKEQIHGQVCASFADPCRRGVPQPRRPRHLSPAPRT